MNQITTEVKVAVGVILACILLVGVGAYFYKGEQVTTPKIEVTQIPNIQQLNREGQHEVKAKQTEKVKVIEFADFQCPACGYAYPGVKSLKETYGDKVTFVYRNYPLSMHLNSLTAAYAAEAAGLQGKFFEMHDMLFEGQAEWSEQVDPSNVFQSYAQKIGLNIDQWKKDKESQFVKDRVEADKKDAEAVGVNSTPTFFIGSSTVRVADKNVLIDAIEAELARVK